MKRLIAHFLLVIFGLGLLVQLAAGDDELTKPVMLDSTNGWWQKIVDRHSQTLHTTDGGKHWLDVSPAAMTTAVQRQPAVEQEDAFLASFVALDPLDAKRAWMAFAPSGQNNVILEYTTDAGKHWQQNTARLEVGESIFISFVDAAHGFLLTMGGGGLGQHSKRVFGTEDGGHTWRSLSAPPGPSFLLSGISFRNVRDGWITGEYRGDDYYPLYRTTDGGKSWTLQHFDIPEDYKGGYGNTYPPVFRGTDKKQGILPVNLVRHEPKPNHQASINYETNDGGATWHIPASGVHSTPLK